MTKYLPVNYRLDRTTFWYVGQSNEKALVYSLAPKKWVMDVGTYRKMSSKMMNASIDAPQKRQRPSTGI